MDVVSLSWHLSVFLSYFPLLVSLGLSHPFTCPQYIFITPPPSPNIHSSLHLSRKFSPSSPPLHLSCLLSDISSHLSHRRLPLSLTLLSPLLPQDPKERLGCHPQTGFADIMGHPFFRNVDWDLVSHSFLSSPHSVFVPSFSASLVAPSQLSS